MNFANYAAVQDYLFGLKAAGVRFGIDRMAGFAAALGHPERAVPIVHVAGTNGKGSVAAMLESILRTAGWRVGLYTSPHLVRLGERVQVDRVALSEAEIAAYTAELQPLADEIGAREADARPSFFEFMTAMAFLQFVRKRCDVAVVEVGMGGRLDATNIVDPQVAVVTSIGLDHCEQLGDTLDKIAAEKAGIIKQARPVVIGRLPADAERVIRGVALERGATVHSVRNAFGEKIENYPATNLEGDYQRWNAATAVLVARQMSARWRLNEEVIARGLQEVNWPGRWQRVSLGGRRLILDASHNPEGASVLEDNLRRLVEETGCKPIVVTGVLGAARARPLLETVARHAKEIHLVVPQQARACTLEELEGLMPRDFAGRVRRGSVEEIFPRAGECRVGGPDDIVVVTGSIYLLGEVLARLEPARGANEARLQDF